MATWKRVTRREFLEAASLLGLGGAAAATLGLPDLALASSHALQFFQRASRTGTGLPREHFIDIRIPVIAEDGSNVPIVVSMDHPMEPDHYISSLHIVNFKDPIVSKGIYRFTPASGQAYIGTQIRMDGGDSEIFVIAECTKHGRWVASRTLKVSLGGC